MEGTGLIRRHEAAIGIATWIIEEKSRIFEINGALEAEYQVEGLAVRFEGRVNPNRTAVLEHGQVIDLTLVGPR